MSTSSQFSQSEPNFPMLNISTYTAKLKLTVAPIQFALWDTESVTKVVLEGPIVPLYVLGQVKSIMLQVHTGFQNLQNSVHVNFCGSSATAFITVDDAYVIASDFFIL